MFCIAPALNSSFSSIRSVNSWLPSASTMRIVPVASITPVVRFQVIWSARSDWSPRFITTLPNAVTMPVSLS